MGEGVKVILDTDPGGDDILALLWLTSLIRQGYGELVAVTTVQGNVSAESTFRNASQVLGVVGLENIPVARGVARNCAEIPCADYIHGQDGMGGLSQKLPPACHDFMTAPTADRLLIEALNRQPGEITIIAIAPLTNLAAAEQQQPGILKAAKEIIIMGGAFAVPGNVSTHGEFNIAYDSEAAATVLNSRDDIVILPLDITHKLIFSPTMLVGIDGDRGNNFLGGFIDDLSRFMSATTLFYRESGGKPGFLVHDAATIAYLFYPETLTWQRAKVEVETQGKFTKGKTFFDNRHIPKSSANAWVAVDVDVDNLLASLIADLRYLLR
ncbi:inosine-uridine preferring nucleoside hydrolase superfamily protein [Calothrix sp. NIES-3974]|nr:inosine-uridine preferring nucleoside hydrolase superfamily protein [Calothrix sp. NIES-3974]